MYVYSRRNVMTVECLSISWLGVKLHEMRDMGATAAIVKAVILDPTLKF
jgi:hypothetical protein